MRLWEALLITGPSRRYFQKALFPASAYWGALATCALVAAGFYLLLRLAASGRVNVRRAAVAAIMGLLTLPANSMRTLLTGAFPKTRQFLELPMLNHLSPVSLSLVAGAAILTGLFVAWKYYGQAERVITFGLEVLSPVFLVMVAHIVLVWLTPAGNTAHSTQSARPSGVPGARTQHNRIVVALFDEWDYRLTFEAAPPRIHLSNLPEVMRQSVWATNAQPATMMTLTAVPSLTSGETVENVGFETADDLTIFTKRHPEGRRWSHTNSIFRLMHDRGWRVGVVGWYHPYCRVFEGLLDQCQWWPAFDYDATQLDSFAKVVHVGLSWMTETATFSPFGDSESAKQHLDVYKQLVQAAEADVANPNLDFVYIHFPIPHPPFIYSGGALSPARRGVAAYPDAIQLVDNTLGRLRDAMLAAGLWDKTTLLLTADHPFRSAAAYDGKMDSRVPLIVRTPGNTSPRPFGKLLRLTSLPQIISMLATTGQFDPKAFAQ